MNVKRMNRLLEATKKQLAERGPMPHMDLAAAVKSAEEVNGEMHNLFRFFAEVKWEKEQELGMHGQTGADKYAFVKKYAPAGHRHGGPQEIKKTLALVSKWFHVYSEAGDAIYKASQEMKAHLGSAWMFQPMGDDDDDD